MRKTIQDLNAMKAKRDKIIALTAYDYQTAEILDEICDLILVGDSLGNVFQGKETTLSVTLDEIIYHAKAVDKALSNAHFCVDMPFMSYQQSTSSALENIGKVFKETNAKSVKIEMNPDLIDLVNKADKIVVMNDGIIEQVGAPLELYNKPSNKFVAGFIGSPKMNFI